MRSSGDGAWRPSGQVFGNSGFWGSSPSDVYSSSVGAEVDYSTGDDRWKPQDTTASNLSGISGTGAHDVYAVANDGIFHSTGDGVWSRQGAPPAPNTDSFECVFALNDRAIYVGSFEGRLLRSGGDRRWLIQDLLVSSSCVITAIWGTSTDNLYLATDCGIYHGVKP